MGAGIAEMLTWEAFRAGMLVAGTAPGDTGAVSDICAIGDIEPIKPGTLASDCG